jgi:hypothetical protein
MSRPTLIYPGVTVSGGGAVTSEYLRVADGTELGTSGKALDDGTDTIALVIDSGQAAASGGLDGLIGAVYWDLGSVSNGNVNTLLEWVTRLPATHVVVAVWRSTSAPTSLADIDGASAHWSQLYQNATNRSNTYLKTGTANLGTTNQENFTTSASMSTTVATDGDGYGGSLIRHDGSGVSKSRALATAFTQASGNFYVALLWGKSATASGEEVIKVKLQGEMLQ